MDMMANYEGLATELLQVNEDLLRVPARHLISKLTQGEHFVLNYLLTHRHQAHPVDLSRGLVVSTARIAALLNRMEDKGLISRLPDPLNPAAGGRRRPSPSPPRGWRPFKPFVPR